MFLSSLIRKLARSEKPNESHFDLVGHVKPVSKACSNCINLQSNTLDLKMKQPVINQGVSRVVVLTAQ